MTETPIRLALPDLATAQTLGDLGSEAALVLGCVLDEIGAAREAVRDLIWASPEAAEAEPAPWSPTESFLSPPG